MKICRFALVLFAIVVNSVLGGIGIQWVTGWGGYAHDAPNVVDYPSDYALLNHTSGTWQLIFAGADGVIDPPDLQQATIGYVSGDDLVLANRTIPQGGGTAIEEGTTWDEYLYVQMGDPTYRDPFWSTPGFVYQRIYEGTPATGSYYYDSLLFAYDVDWTTNDPVQVFFAERDPGNSGFKPDQMIGGSGDSALGAAVDAPELSWSTGGGMSWGWAATTDITHDGVDAASGWATSSGPTESSWIETSVIGPMAISFWWSLTTMMYGSMDFSIDGDVHWGPLQSTTDWQAAVYGIPEGTHTLRWTIHAYYNLYGQSEVYGNLDQVTFLPGVSEIEILGRDHCVVTNGSTTTLTNNGTDFGATFLTGATSSPMFYVRNTGTADLVVSTVTTSGPHSGDFQVTEFPSVVRFGTSSNLSIRFDPSALGGRTAVVTVANNNASEGSYSFAVSGTGIADGPIIRMLGQSVQPIPNGSATITNTLGTDFGAQYLTGFSTSRTFVVTNAGNATLNILAVNRTGANAADFSVESFPATLLPSSRSNLVIRFDPADVGTRSATVQVVSDDAESPTFSFAIGGVGLTDMPEILMYGTQGQTILDGDWTASAADGTYFGGVPIHSGAVERVFTITNSGAVDLVLSPVTFQGTGAVHFSAPSVPARVRPGACSNLVIRFAPEAAGVVTAVVAIANNDGDENPYDFAVRGDGISSHYVWTNSPSPTPPYLTWDTAAHTLQDAVNRCVDGDEVWATNGVYDSGATYQGSATNRLSITHAIRLCSMQGPEQTFIRGDADTRCVYLASGSLLAGFTLTNGQISGYGGGVCGESLSSIVSNCIISGNRSSLGGGVYYSTVYQSRISGNVAEDGGGAHSSSLQGCRILNNQAGGSGASVICDYIFSYASITVFGGGGGVSHSTLNSCLLNGNTANAGGGAIFSDLINCTVAANQATGIQFNAYMLGGGGMFAGSAINCIFDDNHDLGSFGTADADTPKGYCYYYGMGVGIKNSCLNNISGDGNVTGRATFVSGTYELQVGSIGIHGGTNVPATLGARDLAGQPRIYGGIVDMGAYEYTPGSDTADYDGDGIPNDWESLSGLNPGISNSPTIDSDGDGQADMFEYVADTQPTQRDSTFPLLEVIQPPLGSMSLVVDPTSTSRVYGVHWTTNLLAQPQVWTLVPPERSGSGSAVTFTLTNDGPSRIYRTGVRLP